MPESVHVQDRPALNRRNLLRGTAWTVPAVVVASAAPVQAVSCPAGTAFEHKAAPASTASTDTARGEYTFVVPDNVTQMTFDVVGGGGGAYSSPAEGHKGGAGARIRGTLPVEPGQTITLIGGQGGEGPTNWDAGANYGGDGFGNGGDAAQVNRTHYTTGGSGGGGSAILIDGTAVVIAGGGGGSAGQAIWANATHTATYTPEVTGGFGEINGTRVNGENYTMTFKHATFTVNDTVTGGQSALGAAPGVGTQASSNSGSGRNFRVTTANAPGGAASLTAGGNGANGFLGASVSNDSATYGCCTAGGGGGYAGGASGASVVRQNTDGFVNVGTTDYCYAVSGAAGGGSSYISPLATVTEQSLGPAGLDPRVRPSGYSMVTYSC